MSTLPKFELKLNEESEINFKLSIEGSSSEATAPKFRFIMTEMGGEKGWLFPASREEEDIVSVKIPPLKENVQAGKKYHGKLEVILGNMLVVPTELVVEFTRPLQIEATPIVSKPNAPVIKSSTQPALLVNEKAAPAIVSKPVPKPIEAPKPIVKEEIEDDDINAIIAEEIRRIRKEVQLSRDNKETFMQKAFKEQKAPPVSSIRKEAAVRTPAPAPKPVVKSPNEKELLKKKLMEAFRSGLKELK